MTAERTAKMDYYITAAETPSEILEQYTQAVGRSPMMPSCVLGLWQSKLRYKNQKEVLEIADNYKKRNIPLDVLVIDFFIGRSRANSVLNLRIGRIPWAW